MFNRIRLKKNILSSLIIIQELSNENLHPQLYCNGVKNESAKVFRAGNPMIATSNVPWIGLVLYYTNCPLYKRNRRFPARTFLRIY